MDLAFVVGNGINRYGNTEDAQSWDHLLLKLWNKYSGTTTSSIPQGITLTEFYDVLDLKGGEDRPKKLQKEFCNLMKSWKPQAHHKAFIGWAQNHNNPVLTTNFETTLSDCVGAALFHTNSDSFTDYYPWGSYYSRRELADPASSFAIWHINGMQTYPRSIRLGLTHYMGSVERARNWIHKGNESRLFSGKNMTRWIGSKTWLHVIFNKPLVIFGPGLDATEVFLRWLLIERAKYFQKLPDRRKQGWYVFTDSKPRDGQRLFLSSVGIEAVEVSSYADLYETPWSH